jgi:PAS domain S-box-containing protein
LIEELSISPKTNKLLKLKRPFLGVVLIPLFSVLAITVFFMFEALKMGDRSQSIQETGAILRLSSQSLTSVLDMETGLRGFLLTGDESFLEPYTSAKGTIAGSLVKLAQILPPEEFDDEYMLSLRQKVDNWMTYAEGIKERRLRNESVSERSLNLEGKKLTDSIRGDFQMIRERQMLRLMTEQSDAQSAMKLLFVFGGCLAVIISSALSLLLWHRLSNHFDSVLNESLRADGFFKQLKAIIDAAPIAIVYIDRDLNYVFSNEHYRTHYGRPDFPGRPIQDVVGSSSFAAAHSFLKMALEGVTTSFEAKVEREGKKALSVNVILAPHFDDDGRVLGVVVISEDVTEKKEADLLLEQSRSNLDFALQSGRMGTWDIDIKTQSLKCSQEMLELWGIEAAEFSGERSVLQAKVHQEDLEPMKKIMADAIENRHIYELEYRIHPSAFAEKWVLSRGRCSYDAVTDLPTRFSGVVYDITELKKTQAEIAESRDLAEKANYAKTQFLANMSHEIRTPVGAILGFSGMLKRGSADPAEQANFMGIIERNSQNLLRLIDDILDLSKVEAGKIVLQKTSVFLPEFLAEFAATMKLRTDEKQIRFTLIIDGQIPNVIVTDQLRLRQILSNLAGNSVKFTDSGEVRVSVQFEKPILKFMVQDTGPGISEESAKRLFQMFGQADPTLTRKFGGTGLGLVLSKRLGQALGGDVKLVASQVGQGSTFEATIEVATPQSVRMITQNDLSVVPAKVNEVIELTEEFHGLKILLVEDSNDNRTLIQHYLRGSGVELLMAEDGEEGLHKAIEFKPDLVLMDIQMPKMDGHEATKALRERSFGQPIVALTAHAMREERERCIASGFDDYLTKPIDKRVLREVIQKYDPRSD